MLLTLSDSPASCPLPSCAARGRGRGCPVTFPCCPVSGLAVEKRLGVRLGQRHSGAGLALSARRSHTVPSGLGCSGGQRVLLNTFPVVLVLLLVPKFGVSHTITWAVSAWCVVADAVTSAWCHQPYRTPPESPCGHWSPPDGAGFTTGSAWVCPRAESDHTGGPGVTLPALCLVNASGYGCAPPALSRRHQHSCGV